MSKYQNLFIVDNSKTEWSVKRYLKDWCDISQKMDVATGYFEIGGLLDLDEKWKKLDKIRILFGDEVTRRTKEMFQEALNNIIRKLENSIELEKEHNEFLIGVPAIIKAIRDGKIECRVYKRDKFHAKAYITYMRYEYYDRIAEALNIPNGYALVGSSNFTKPGLNQNIELNVQIRNDVDQLQDWFEKHWNEAENITPEVLKVVEKHTKEYSPYDVYLRSMYEFFKGQDKSVSEWENTSSKVYPILAQYQKDGYHSMLNIADKYNGAFLCDGVGLGKTFIGLMIIERLVFKERKNVVLIVPASTRISVWEDNIKKFMPQILEGFYPFKIINHTDLVLEKNSNLMNQIAEQAECIIIDEAHHFRNRSSNRYRKLFEVIGVGFTKKLFMLTATPINNSFLDFQHMIELFTQRKDDYFKEPPLGIHSLIGHFRKMEHNLEEIIGNDKNAQENDANIFSSEVDQVFRGDPLVNELVVQRSRSYVKKSLANTEGNNVLFPIRKAPIVVNYSLEKAYGKLIHNFTKSFYRVDKKTNKVKPILFLAVYSPYDEPYYIGGLDKIDAMKKGRQAQVVNLIRLLMLKRFESSAVAFEETCIKIFARLFKFVSEYTNDRTIKIFENFINRKSDVVELVKEKYKKEFEKEIEDADDEFPDYAWDLEENITEKDFDIEQMVIDTISDLETLSTFIDDLSYVKPESDDKLQALINLVQNDSKLKNKKLLIFTEYRATAKYLYSQLKKLGIKNIFELDGQSKVDRKDVITRFSPYYNNSSSKELDNEIDVLISTDVLAEGLNLQDATCMINYELHWNPVKLMQRIGRVDRRRSLEIENKLIKDHPDLKTDRENIYFWNFLPPRELENLLSLFEKVSKKTLRISKAFGIEGRKLLTPNDDYDALKEFNQSYEGNETKEEEMVLEFQKLMKDNSDYDDIVSNLPRRMYSGRLKSTYKGIFFCYKLPIKNSNGEWSIDDGITKWYIYNELNNSVLEFPYLIWKEIQSSATDGRLVSITVEEFTEAKKKIEKHIKNIYLKPTQAPIGVKQRLITWMQLF